MRTTYTISTSTGSILFILSFFFLNINNAIAYTNASQEITIQYYSTTLQMDLDPAMLKKNKYCTSQLCLENFYNKIEETNYKLLLNDLLKYREKLQLNDWFYYVLVQKTMEQIFPKKKSMYRTNYAWFFMTKSGYDTRLYTAQNKFSFLYLRTDDEVYEMPFLKVNGDFYLDVTSIYYKAKTKGLLMEMQKFQPGTLNTQTFSLKINNYPDIPPMIVTKEFSFTHQQKKIKFQVDIDTVANQLLSNYPFVKAINYIETPLTKTTKKSLTKAIQPHIKNLEIEDQLSFFVSFSRKAFEFKNDQIRFRRDKPLTAEQTLVASMSDFEDRAALMYQLILETTELNFIIVEYLYDDIITVGVEFPEVFGKPFIHQGVNYTICDPSMPTNTGKLGIYPINLDKDFEVIKEVMQQVEVGMKD